MGGGAGASPVPAVAVLGLRAQQLTRQVGHGHLALGAGLEVPQLDVARLQLVAADDREMGAGPDRALELLAELAAWSGRRVHARPAPRSSVATWSRTTVSCGVRAHHDGGGSPGLRRRSADCSASANATRSRPMPKPMPGVGWPPRSSTRPS